jgi:nucleotidyltransferase substrate binding protein (TIGR01987 family)
MVCEGGQPRLQEDALVAVASLEKAIYRSLREPEDEEVRDCVVQRFEYTYELCWKMLKRRMEMDAAGPVDSWPYRELIRRGAEAGFSGDPEAWFEYRDQRNRTSHVYDESVAIEVHRSAVMFAGAARALLQTLTQASDAP